MMKVHRFSSRVSVRRAARALQTSPGGASHSEAATATAQGKERTR